MVHPPEGAKDGSKPTVLLCWGYHRSGWNEVFDRLSPLFNFHYLFFFSPRLARGYTPKEPVHFWIDFTSPNEVLARIQPSVIVFMGLDGVQTIALNIAARRANVATVYLQHGILLPLCQSLSITATAAGNSKTPSSFSLNRSEKLHQLLFFLRALDLRSLDALAFLWRWQLARRRSGDHAALAQNPSRHRVAHLYAVYTLNGATDYLIPRDRVAVGQFVEIGNPHLDEYFSRDSRPAKESYELFIDQPICGAPELPMSIKTRDEVARLYHRLAQFCQSRDTKLVVKLHPYSYGNAPRIEHANIQFLEDVDDLPGLVLRSRSVYGYYSTLLLPALALKPCCLFDIGVSNSLQDRARELDLAEIVNFEALPNPKFHMNTEKKGLTSFISDFLYKADGRSTERLGKFLLEISRKNTGGQ